jgi:hypothetical protein
MLAGMGTTLTEYHGLSTQEARFVVLAAAGVLDLGQSFTRAGYECRPGQEEFSARNLLRRPHIAAAFHTEIARLLSQDASIARAVVLDIIKDTSVPPKTRGDLAIKLLDRGGHVAPRAIAQETRAERSLHELSAGELRTMVDTMEAELARRAKPVNSANAPAAPSDLSDLIE